MARKLTVHKDAPGRGGFALVELAVVTVVIGVLVLIAFPAIDVLRPQVESAMMGLGSTLQQAQREAVARQHDVIVTFDAPNGQVLLHYDANNNGVRDPGERVRGMGLDPTVVFGRSTAPARPFGAGPVSFGPAGAQRLTFRRNGSASAAGGFYVTSAKAQAGAADRLRDTRAVEVVRATGRVEWWRYLNGQWQRGF